MKLTNDELLVLISYHADTIAGCYGSLQASSYDEKKAYLQVVAKRINELIAALLSDKA